MGNNADIPSVVFGAFTAFWETILGFLPNVIATFLVLILGLALAKIAKVVVERLLKLFHFDQLVEKTGLETYISSGGDYKVRFSALISGTIYWLIILMAITSIADLLRLKVISDLFERVVLYLPNIIIALVILIIGTIFSRIVNRHVFNLIKKIGMDMALGVAIVCEVVVQVFTWFLALEQLQINTVLLTVVLSSIFFAFALATAIAFGLAGQKLASDLIDKARKKIEGGIDE